MLIAMANCYKKFSVDTIVATRTGVHVILSHYTVWLKVNSSLLVILWGWILPRSVLWVSWKQECAFPLARQSNNLVRYF
jgi:hypothetical protein